MDNPTASWASELGLGTPFRPDGSPKVLFKYLPGSRLDVLENNAIRFTQPNLFNDAFDCRPYFRNLPAQPRGWWDATDVWMDDEPFSFAAYMETCVQANNGISPQLRGDDLRQFLLGSLGSVVGVLSLSEVPSNHLMWGHYADSHRGFVLGFDTCSSFFRCGDRTTEPTQDGFFPVRYADERPRRRSYRDVTAADAFFTKSVDWSYEREWRQWRLVRSADVTIDSPSEQSDEEVALFEFPREAVRFVLLGMDMLPETRARLARTLTVPSDYRESVQVFNASIHARWYRMKFEREQWRR